jgi:hypothetical protein
MTTSPKFPDITVELSGENGNAYVILGRVRRALRQADIPAADIESFSTEAMSGDYDHVLRTCMAWVNVT